MLFFGSQYVIFRHYIITIAECVAYISNSMSEAVAICKDNKDICLKYAFLFLVFATYQWFASDELTLLTSFNALSVCFCDVCGVYLLK